MGVAAYYICLNLIGPEIANHEKLEQGCADYVQKALPIIISSWSIDAWRERSSSELIVSTNVKKLTRQFNVYRKFLGEFRGMEVPTGYVIVDNSGGVNETIAFYSTRARYQVGSVDITLRLVKRGGGWKLQKFNVRSDHTDAEL